MLRINQQSNSQAAKSYYSTADYLSEGQEIVGSWGGSGARRLGLDGVVDRDAFDRLCDNLDPRTGQPLTARTRADRTVGNDLTFSVPKSVSLLYALTGDREVVEAFRAAVDETMRDIESEAKARVRKAGQDADRRTGNLVWAEFLHTTSRPVDGVADPQLHAHCFTFNATWDEHERQWKAVQYRDIKRDAPYHQAAFRVRLANRLQDLGFGIERKRDDFEIAGIAPAVLKRFSRRTQEIDAKAEELGITDPKRKAELGAQTRQKKSRRLTWNELRQEWDSRLTQSERESMAAAHRREIPPTRPGCGPAAAVDFALEHVLDRKSVAAERELLTEAFKRGLGGVTVDSVRRELSRRSLIRAEKDGRTIVTSAAVLAEERAVVDIARRGRGRFRPLGNPDRPVNRAWLNAEQQAAVRHVLGSRDRIILIRGAAGTGKTTLEMELRDALGEVGKPCVAVAPSASASRGVLRDEAGFATADTVSRFLKDRKMQEEARAGVILFDEASLLGSKDTLALFQKAEELGSRVVVLGDKRQHRSVSRGQTLKLLEQEAGLPVAEVSEILRQTGQYKKAAKALSDGRTAEGLYELDRLGWVKELPDDERYPALAGAYLSATREKKRNGDSKTALVVTATHGEADRIAEAIRAELKAGGKLGEERVLPAWIPAHLTAAEKADAVNYEEGDLLAFHQNAPGIPNGSRRVVAGRLDLPLAHANRFEVYRPSTLRVAVGDRVRVTANGRTKDGQRLDNGALFTVKAFTPRGVVLSNGWIVPTDEGVHLAQGYAVTTQAAQGRTVDQVFIGLSGHSLAATNARSAYVAATRGKEKALIFTDDKGELLKAMQQVDDPMSALELERARQRLRPLRHRLQKHLASLRRQITFAHAHPNYVTGRESTTNLQRETGHER